MSDAAAPRRAGIGPNLAVAGVLAVVLIGALGVVLVTQRRDPVTHRFVIPAGTGARIDRGERVTVFPKVLRVRVGDRLFVRNDDDRRHHAGPIAVDPHSRFEMTFGRAGELRGECTLNPAGSYRIIVGT